MKLKNWLLTTFIGLAFLSFAASVVPQVTSFKVFDDGAFISRLVEINCTGDLSCTENLTTGKIDFDVTAGLSGSGTTGVIPIWTAATTLGDSVLTESGGVIIASGVIASDADSGQIVLDGDEPSGFTGTITFPSKTAAQTFTLPDASGTFTLLGSSIDLTSEVTGTLPVGSGGTGATSHTSGAILLGSGASAIANLGVLADDTLVLGDGVTAPGTASVPDCDATDDALNYDVTGNAFSCQSIDTGVSGSGTTDTIPKWTAGTVLGDSSITDDGTTIDLTNIVTATASSTLGVGASGSIVNVAGTLVEAASGTHVNLDGTLFDPPTITGGAASVTNAATVRISGDPSASGANNRALAVEGTSQLQNITYDTDATYDIGAATLGIRNLYIDGDIISSDNSNTTISVVSGLIRIDVNSFRMVDFVSSLSEEIVFNQANADIDFRIETDNFATTFAVNGGTDNIGFFDVTPNSTSLVELAGSHTGTPNFRLTGLNLIPSITADVNNSVSIFSVTGTLVEAGSGTHANLDGTLFNAPTITAGAGAVTTAATVRISGDPAASGAVNKALLIEGSTLIDGASDVVHLTIQGDASQTAVLQSWQNSSGTEFAHVAVDGHFAASDGGGSTVAYAQLGDLDTGIGWPGSGFASFFTDNEEILRANGVVTTFNPNSTDIDWLMNADDGEDVMFIEGDTTPYITFGNNSVNLGAFINIDNDEDRLMLLLQGHSTQTSDLLTLETSAGTDLLTIGGDGLFSSFASVSPSAGADATLFTIAGTITEAGSGTHANLDGALFAAPTVVAGAAAVTNAATVRISGAPSAVGATNDALLVQGQSTVQDIFFEADSTYDIGTTTVRANHIYTDDITITGASLGLSADGSAADVFLARDAANTLALRNGTTTQNFHFYNTFTDASNYERMTMQVTSADFQILTESAGTGSARDLQLGTSGGANIKIIGAGSVIWQFQSSGNFIAISDNSFDIGNTASTSRPRNLFLGTGIDVGNGSIFDVDSSSMEVGASTSLFDGSLSVTADTDGASFNIATTLVEAGSGTHANLDGALFDAPTITGGAAAVTNAATVRISGAPSASGAVNDALLVQGQSTVQDIFFEADSTYDIGTVTVRAQHIYTDDITIGGASLGLSDTGSAADVFLKRDAADVLAQRNSTTAQEHRIYSTFTDSSNYERLAITLGNLPTILTESAGTGTQRGLIIGSGGGSPSFGVFIREAGTDVWKWDTSTSQGDYVPVSDSTYDIGTASLRPAEVYVDDIIAEQIGLSAAGGAADVFLIRTAANELAIRNGTTQQLLIVQKTFTDAANFEQMELGHFSNVSTIRTIENGTGVSRDLRLATTGSADVGFTTSNTLRWEVTGADGDLVPFADSSYDIGTASLRPATIHSDDILARRIGTANVADTLGAAVTTIAITSNVETITGDGGGNTIATITGGVDGAVLKLIFTDGNVTITDDDTHAADSVDLSAAFTSADDTTLTLVYDGTSWYELSRSTN